MEYYFFKLFTSKKKKIIVITGCGRSGTTFSSKLLKQMGIKIGHERMKKDGISSWYISSNKDKVPIGLSFKDIKSLNTVIIHQTREPLSLISSIQSIGSPSWIFLEDEIPISFQKDSRILKAMKYYYYWNKKAENISDVRVKVEEFQEKIIEILEHNNINYSTQNVDLNKKNKVNTRNHSILSWDDLYQEDEALTKKIIKLSKKYGY